MVNNCLIKTSLEIKWLFAFYVCLVALLAGVGGTSAQPVAVPNHFDPGERLVLPDLSDRPRFRFLTTTDFPPFNFLDQNGRLAGFHIDLVRAICAELDIDPRCQVQALPWNELEEALLDGEGEAIIAGLSVTGENRERFRFTRSFIKLPARFIEKGKPDAESRSRSAAKVLAGKRVGVLQGSAHEAMLEAFFPKVEPLAFGRSTIMFRALKSGRIDAAFGDGVNLSFWLGSERAEGCCRFLDGPFFSDHFLGHGLAIAVKPEDAELAAAFDYAMLALNKKGRIAEIYLRYFPNGLY